MGEGERTEHQESTARRMAGRDVGNYGMPEIRAGRNGEQPLGIALMKYVYLVLIRRTIKTNQLFTCH